MNIEKRWNVREWEKKEDTVKVITSVNWLTKYFTHFLIYFVNKLITSSKSYLSVSRDQCNAVG